MNKIRVAVIRGGISDEYAVSLKTGAAVLTNLPDHYQCIDVLIDTKGVWHCNSVPQSPQRIFSHVDVVFNALHGYYGEDGKLQHLLESFGIPYTGSDSLSSALGMNKALTKRSYKEEGIPTPYYATIGRGDNIHHEASEIYKQFPHPAIIKPTNGGSSFGVTIVRNLDEFLAAITNELSYSREALVEEYHEGFEVTCAIIENFRGEAYYALPPIEIVPATHCAFFDYDAKYNGHSQELCPAPSLSLAQKREVIALARRAHRALGLRHYSRTDMIVTKEGITVLETNTLPGLTEGSLVPLALEAVGCPLSVFLDHIIREAMRRK